MSYLFRIFLFVLISPTLFYAEEFRSLWLDSKRTSWPELQSNLSCDVAIVGGGISGVATLYYLLTTTDKKVALLEKNFIASGATGHNAGLPVAYIERPITELVEEFGLELVKEGYKELELGKTFLYDIAKKIGFESQLCFIPEVYFGLASIADLLDSLKNNDLFKQIGHDSSSYWVLNDEKIKEQIPLEYHASIQWVSQKQILDALEIKNLECIGLIQRKDRLRMNSSLFCNQVLEYLVKKFPKRCLIYEQTEIAKIDLQDEKQILHHPLGQVFAQDVILCTNAFTDFLIFDERTGKPVTKLKEMMIPIEGYLAAYRSSATRSSAIGFSGGKFELVPYWYLSVAPLSQNKEERIGLIGGPEFPHTAPLTAQQIKEQAHESLNSIKQFLGHRFENPSSFPYFWHGTMGYTPSGLRWVGEDPNHRHLWYNLGCNGIGIIPSLSSGQKIARKMSGEVLPVSIFDPPEDKSPFTTYQMAFVRGLSDSFEESLKLAPPPVPINLDLAKQQHENYIQLLKELLEQVVELDPDSSHPDCNFIEDTAIIVGEDAVISRMGAIERQGEELPVAKAIEHLGTKKVTYIQAPATIDGGDILYTGNHLFVGLSRRTNRQALEQLKEIFQGKVDVIGIPVTDGLHLKSILTALDSDTLVVADSRAGREIQNLISETTQNSYAFIVVPDSVASNVLRIHSTLIVQEGYPESEAILQQHCTAKGLQLKTINMSELIKADGALTCGSLLLE